MRSFIMSVAIVATLLVATSAKAELAGFTQFGAPGGWERAIQQYMEWRTTGWSWAGAAENYTAGSEVITLIALEKGGALGSTNGERRWWSDNPNAWNASVNGSIYTFNFEGAGYNVTAPGERYGDFVVPNIQDIGIVLTGSSGGNGLLGFGATGLRGNLSITVDGTTVNLGTVLSGAGI